MLQWLRQRPYLLQTLNNVDRETRFRWLWWPMEFKLTPFSTTSMSHGSAVDTCNTVIRIQECRVPAIPTVHQLRYILWCRLYACKFGQLIAKFMRKCVELNFRKNGACNGSSYMTSLCNASFDHHWNSTQFTKLPYFLALLPDDSCCIRFAASALLPIHPVLACGVVSLSSRRAIPLPLVGSIYGRLQQARERLNAVQKKLILSALLWNSSVTRLV